MFATGSRTAYVVTGSAVAREMDISDKVTFNNFNLNNNGGGIVVKLNAGASVGVGLGSVLNLLGDFYSASDGSLNIAAQSTLNDSGVISNGFLNVAGTLNVSGPSAKVSGINNHDQISGGTVSTGGVINITNGGHLTDTFAGMDGTINISGAGSTYSVSGVAGVLGSTAAADGRINGSNGAVLSVSGGIANSGVITAVSGRFDVTGQVTSGSGGTGSFQVDSGATLELGGSSNAAVGFQANATLQLDKGVTETGTLVNFATGDAVDLLGVALTGYNVYASGGATTLTLFNGASVADTFTLSGTYGTGNFTFRGDGHGGALMSFVPSYGTGPTTFNWKAAKSGSWNTPASWAQNAAPHADPNPNPFLSAAAGSSSDTAVFATGSKNVYAVTGTALAQGIDVSDKVTFSNFHLSNGNLSTVLQTRAGAAVTVSADSTLSLRGDYMYAEGAVDVAAGSTLTDYGSITGFTCDISGTLNVAGSSAKVYESLTHDVHTAGTLEKGGAINVSSGGYFSSLLNEIDGTINISGSGSTVAELVNTKLSSTGQINGGSGGVLSGSIANSGLITAQSGKFTVTGAIAGTGSFKVAQGATLELGGNSSENVAFLNSATLQLDKGVAETGFLQNFSTGDAVDMLGVGLTGYNVVTSAGITTVSLYNGASLADTFKLSGNYASSNFTFRGDGHGGALMSYVPPATHTVMPVLHG